MKLSTILYLIVGCLSLIFGIDRYFRLSAQEAKDLALHLANKESLAKFKIEPFQDGRDATLENGRWTWGGLSAVGKVDISADVSFDAYGNNPLTKIWLMSSLGIPERVIFKTLDQDGGPQ
jgi:hypothetical protein